MDAAKLEMPSEKPEVTPPVEDQQPQAPERRERRRHHHRRGVVKISSNSLFETSLGSCLEVLHSRRELILRAEGVDTLNLLRELIRDINEKFPKRPDECEVKITAKIGYKTRRRQH